MGRDRFTAGRMKIIILFLIMAALFGCRASQTPLVPQELLGVWGTSDPDYRGCTFEITDRVIIFENDEDFIRVNWIKETKKLTRRGEVLYRIDYEDRDALAFTTSLVYEKTESGDVLRFANMNQVAWIKIAGPTM